MSFGVSVRNGALEYGGGDLRQLFAQKRNVLRPRFWSMVRDILRFYREAPEMLNSASDESLGDWLQRNRYGTSFIQDHILPMGAAIWSSSVTGMRAFPARHFVRFFHNHGLLRVTDRPAWRTVDGGSRRYVSRMLQDLVGQFEPSARVLRVRRDQGVTLEFADGQAKKFDQVVLACHADQALAMIDRPSAGETELLGAIRFADNLAVLHTDLALMPRRRRVWSAWNYLSRGSIDHGQSVSVTYWMNCLQGLRTRRPLLVSLNPLTPPAPEQILCTRQYRHPQFDAASMRAQARLDEIQGRDRVWFAGAWTGWGFHEDGIASAVRVAAGLGVLPPWAQPAGARMAA
jgi:predicted NAD/FAD-binding protein